MMLTKVQLDSFKAVKVIIKNCIITNHEIVFFFLCRHTRKVIDMKRWENMVQSTHTCLHIGCLCVMDLYCTCDYPIWKQPRFKLLICGMTSRRLILTSRLKEHSMSIQKIVMSLESVSQSNVLQPMLSYIFNKCSHRDLCYSTCTLGVFKHLP